MYYDGFLSPPVHIPWWAYMSFCLSVRPSSCIFLSFQLGGGHSKVFFSILSKPPEIINGSSVRIGKENKSRIPSTSFSDGKPMRWTLDLSSLFVVARPVFLFMCCVIVNQCFSRVYALVGCTIFSSLMFKFLSTSSWRLSRCDLSEIRIYMYQSYSTNQHMFESSTASLITDKKLLDLSAA